MSDELQLQAGGTLNSRRHLYIERQEDEKFFQLLEQAEYVNVLSSRQMGKSSLMMRAVQRLSERGIKSVTIDLASELGSPPDLNAFYLGLLSKIVRMLALQIDLKTWWDERGAETVNQRLLRFFREIVGGAIAEPVVIFLDEIDSTLKLPYTDDLFTAIRGMYNDRPMVEAYRRITFCLLGVATPNELIKDRRTTAYNVGTPLTLRDFERGVDDLLPLTAVLNPDPETSNRLLDRIIYWSGGQPYLTQKLCLDVVANRIGVNSLDEFVTHAFENLGQASNDVHFQQILRFLEDRLSDESATIDLYAKVLEGAGVPDRTTLANAELKLSGLVKRDNQGNLVVRNPIYRRLFDKIWVQGTRPRRALSRTRSYAAAASIAFVLLLGGGAGYYINVIQPNQIRLAALDRLASLKISVTDSNAGDGLKARFPDGATSELLQQAIPLLKNAGMITEIEPAKEPADPRKRNDPQGFSGQMNDLAPFSELSKLRSLDLTGLKVSNLGSLAGLEQLKILLLGSASKKSPENDKGELYPLADISPLKRLKNLQRLSLSGTSVSDISPLSSIGSLVKLDISRTEVADLQPLGGLENLETLDASDTQVQNLNVLAGLKSLEELSLDNTQVSDISPLSDLTRMKRLSLWKLQIKNIAPLSGMVYLRSLTIGRATVVDLAPLARLSELTTLIVAFTPVSDLGPLRGLIKLDGLMLDGTSVKDVSPLRNLVNLRILFLSNTQIDDARPLSGLTNILYLSLDGTKVPSEQLKLLRQNLPKAKIFSDDTSIPVDPSDPSGSDEPNRSAN
jgi:Leucine-rich repeat (LRR) protein